MRPRASRWFDDSTVVDEQGKPLCAGGHLGGQQVVHADLAAVAQFSELDGPAYTATIDIYIRAEGNVAPVDVLEWRFGVCLAVDAVGIDRQGQPLAAEQDRFKRAAITLRYPHLPLTVFSSTDTIVVEPRGRERIAIFWAQGEFTSREQALPMTYYIRTRHRHYSGTLGDVYAGAVRSVDSSGQTP